MFIEQADHANGSARERSDYVRYAQSNAAAPADTADGYSVSRAGAAWRLDLFSGKSAGGDNRLPQIRPSLTNSRHESTRSAG